MYNRNALGPFYIFVLFSRFTESHAGGSRKLSAVAAGHTMHVKEKHYEKVGEDFEQEFTSH